MELDRLALGVPYQDKSNIARWSHTGGSDLRCRGNTWFIPYETIQSRAKERPHPATFPVQLAEWCIKLHGISRTETMLDPFLGIGNSAVAAQALRRERNLSDLKSTRLILKRRNDASIQTNHAVHRLNIRSASTCFTIGLCSLANCE